ncbi:MAG TPA: biotin/lipoyl-containing protein, partial [Acetobacteraceae bacterium]|nr:biotin/lipoyl-containing protein [Acetobacteraceae bacterium]
MSTEIKVPGLGESVTSATVARWMKKPGEAVAADEPLVELETDKVTVEVNAPAAGVLGEIIAAEGAEVEVGAVLGLVEAGTAAASAKPAAPKKPEPQPAAQPAAGVNPPPRPTGPVSRPGMPAAAKMMTEQRIAAEQVGVGSGKDGRITKGDV